MKAVSSVEARWKLGSHVRSTVFRALKEIPFDCSSIFPDLLMMCCSLYTHIHTIKTFESIPSKLGIGHQKVYVHGGSMDLWDNICTHCRAPTHMVFMKLECVSASRLHFGKSNCMKTTGT